MRECPCDVVPCGQKGYPCEETIETDEGTEMLGKTNTNLWLPTYHFAEEQDNEEGSDKPPLTT